MQGNNYRLVIKGSRLILGGNVQFKSGYTNELMRAQCTPKVDQAMGLKYIRKYGGKFCVLDPSSITADSSRTKPCGGGSSLLASKKKASPSKALTKLPALASVSQPSERKARRARASMREVLPARPAGRVFDISDELQAKGEVVGNSLATIVKVFSPGTQHAALTTFTSAFDQLHIGDAESAKSVEDGDVFGVLL